MTHTQTPLVLIPGAGRLACSLWPLQALVDPTLIPIDYERGLQNKTKASLLHHYGKRVYRKIRDLKGPLDIIGWSMGFPVALSALKHADKHRPGLVRKLVGINPGVYGGKPLYNFHLDPRYVAQIWYSTHVDRGTRTNTAVKRIRKRILKFNYVCREDVRAMMEAGDGVVKVPTHLDPERVIIYYSPEDSIIPIHITEHCARRANFKAVAIHGYDHDTPLLDTEGIVLERIRADCNI